MLVAHLLKWQYQPSLQNGSWEASIYASRKGVERVVADQPSLKKYWEEILPKAYEEAKKLAQKETKLLGVLHCWALEKLLSNWWDAFAPGSVIKKLLLRDVFPESQLIGNGLRLFDHLNSCYLQ